MFVWSLRTERLRRSTWSLTCTAKFSSHCEKTQRRFVLCTSMRGQEQLYGTTELTSIRTCFITGSRLHGWNRTAKSPESGTKACHLKELRPRRDPQLGLENRVEPCRFLR